MRTKLLSVMCDPSTPQHLCDAADELWGAVALLPTATTDLREACSNAVDHIETMANDVSVLRVLLDRVHVLAAAPPAPPTPPMSIPTPTPAPTFLIQEQN